ncbi:MAG: hypothetical protein U5K51_09930 [Flavobacteriaceae bacterium]|nr:hypothetical protein [Flavobacteriaceae bacterium]
MNITLNEIKDIQEEISNNQKIIFLAKETLENASVLIRVGRVQLLMCSMPSYPCQRPP